ncbi:hypothetical protein DP44_4841 [Burkholderia pseudomallei]|nr:hypothetical protein DP44_4841 [Burkholderia pseudomallei]
MVEPHLRRLRNHVVQIAERLAKRGRHERLVAEIAREHDGRRARRALTARIAQHLERRIRRMRDRAVQARLERAHRIGDARVRPHLALDEQQRREIRDHRGQIGRLAVPVEQRHVQHERVLAAPAREHRGERIAEHRRQRHAMLRRALPQARELGGAQRVRAPAEARRADRFGRARERQRRAVRQVGEPRLPVPARGLTGRARGGRALREINGKPRRRRIGQRRGRCVRGADLVHQEPHAVDIGGEQIDAQPHAILAVRHLRESGDENLRARDIEAFVRAKRAQRGPFGFGLRRRPAAPVAVIEYGRIGRGDDLLPPADKARAQHRVTSAHEPARRGETLRIDPAAAEFEERMATHVAEHLTRAAAEPIGLLNRG